MTEKRKEDLRAYRPGRLTILQLMFVLAMLGLVSTYVLHRFFG
jgi:hypothetical protein